jgi:hypothetical protein
VSAPFGSIRDLSIALYHCWNPDKIFVIFTVFLDESGTHGGSPVTIMGGVYGTARQWVIYERRLKALRREYGFREFHAKKFKNGVGDFEGWSREKKLNLVCALSDLIDDEMTGSVVVHLDNEKYQTSFRDGLVARKTRIDTKYGLVFRCCLSHLVHEIISISRKCGGKIHKNILNVVLEDGHKNAGDAVRIFRETAEEAAQSSFGHLFGAISFASKATCPPLAVADFSAHTSFLIEKHMKRGFSFTGDDRGPKSKVRMFRLSSRTLANQRKGVLEREEKRIAFGKRKAAMAAPSAEEP